VTTAENGQQAVDLLRERIFDLVLMDCQMPVMDGFAATEAIRRMPAPKGTVPIVALTANALAEDRQRCLDCGMDEYLPKPLDPDELMRLVRTFTMRAA
jgi:CheY-like chemotaxis protein